jgi:hypothetical protein
MPSEKSGFKINEKLDTLNHLKIDTNERQRFLMIKLTMTADDDNSWSCIEGKKNNKKKQNTR